MMIYLNDINESGDGAFGVHPCSSKIARDIDSGLMVQKKFCR